MHDRHNGITSDENDMKQLQLHTHKVQAKSTCKFEAHDKKLACLGVGDYSGKNAERSRKELPETVLSRRGCLRAMAKWSFSECSNIKKMVPSKRARRTEKLSVGITSFGVTGKKIRTFKAQGLVYKNTSTNRSLVV